MEDKTITTGIRLKREIAEKLDELLKNLPELNTTRSEFLEATTELFFLSKFDHVEKARKIIIEKRKREHINS